jgi:hypothetical protein
MHVVLQQLEPEHELLSTAGCNCGGPFARGCVCYQSAPAHASTLKPLSGPPTWLHSAHQY